jgi:hypothetical protein
MPEEIAYIRRHDDQLFSNGLSPCAPNSEFLSGLGCRVRTTEYRTTKNPAAGWVF